MKKLIRWFCKILGFETCYLVTAIYKEDDGSIGVMSSTCTVTP